MTEQTDKQPARVLVIRVGRLGDTVMATTIIEPIRRTFGPDVEIDWASGTGSSNVILKQDPRIHRVFPIEHRRIPWPFHKVKRELRRRSRKNPYDLVVNLEFTPQCDDFAGFIRYKNFCGRPRVTPEHQPGQHTVDADKRLYGGHLEVGLDGPLLKMALDPDLAVLPAGEKFVMLNPGFSGVLGEGYHINRGWPIEHWQELIRIITEEFGLSVAINGSPDEGEHFKSLVDLPGVYSMFGSSIPELANAVRDAECLVSVDTGTMHLGAAMGAPTIALFGPSMPDLTGPYLSVTPGKVLSSNIECQPCYGTSHRKTCEFNRCMHELMPEAVGQTMAGLLKSSGD
jgi:ADP-heptose:LPS heptosyltransferase